MTAGAFSALLFFNFQNAHAKTIHTYAVDQLSQVRYTADTMFEQVWKELLQYSTNPDVLKLLNYANMSELQRYQTLRSLSSLTNSTQFGEYLSFYGPNASTVYYNMKAYPLKQFPDQSLLSLLREIDRSEVE